MSFYMIILSINIHIITFNSWNNIYAIAFLRI